MATDGTELTHNDSKVTYLITLFHQIDQNLNQNTILKRPRCDHNCDFPIQRVYTV